MIAMLNVTHQNSRIALSAHLLKEVMSPFLFRLLSRRIKELERSHLCWLGQLKKKLFKNLTLCYQNIEFILGQDNVFLLILPFLDEASTEVLNWPFLVVLDWLTFWLWNISFNGGVKYRIGCDVINEWNFPEVASVEILEHFSEQQHSYSSGICAVRRGSTSAAEVTRQWLCN